MTRFEMMKSASKEDIARMLCSIFEHLDIDEWECGVCPAGDFCRMGHNGFEEWLDKEEVNDQR